MKAILFDLYGTLIDIHTEEGNKSFWKRLARKTKKYKAYDDKKLRRQYLTLCSRCAEEKEEIDIVEVFQELYSVNKTEGLNIAKVFRRLSTKHLSLYKGVLQVLTSLKENGYGIYLLSNAQASFTIPELKKLDIYSIFDGIAISSEYGIKKPNKDFFKRAISDFNLSGQIWMIGNDAECDIRPAEELGLKTIFIESNLTPPNVERDKVQGFQPKEILKKIYGINLGNQY